MNNRRNVMKTSMLLAIAALPAFVSACATMSGAGAPVSYSSVATLAGSGTAGTQNGTGTAAQLNRPHGLAVAGDGTVYVSDRGNHQVRVIGPDGTVRTLAGSTQGFADAPGAKAQFYDPVAVAVDRSGNVYVADRNNHRIRRISPDGAVVTFAGSGTAG